MRDDERRTESDRLRSELERTQAELIEARAATVSLRAALTASKVEVSTLYASASWRITKPLRLVWDFGHGLPGFFRELRDFPRRARYTVAERGASALLTDIRDELGNRLRRGSLAPASRGQHAIPGVGLERARPRPSTPLHFPIHTAPKVSIVIPAYNEFASTYACLASILECSGDVAYEVLISDDGSSDETRRAERMAPGVRLLRSDENRGFIDACNRGAAAATGEVLVFLNNDTLVTEDWLANLLAPFESDEVGLVGARLVYPDGRLQEAGGLIFSDGSGWNFGRGDDAAMPQYSHRYEPDYCSGACLAIPRDLFREIGGFDTHFSPMYYEDVDLAFSVRAAGRRVVYEPRCTIIHAEGTTSGTDTGSGAKRFQAINQHKFVEKWSNELASHCAPGCPPTEARHRKRRACVLVIDSYTPRPDRDAGSARMALVLESLKALDCDVTFLPENRAHDGSYTHSLQAAGVEAFYHPYLNSLDDHLLDFGDRYDAVVMSRVEVAELVMDAVQRHCPNALRVFDTVDLHFLRERRRSELDGLQDLRRADEMMARELAIARACDVTLVVSPAEKELLQREAPDVRVEIVSLIQSAEPTNTPLDDRRGLVFVGSFQHPPNLDALDWYLREVHPRVRAGAPGLEFTVIGADPPASLTALAGEGVRFLGHVAELEPHFASARLSVAPLRYGAGIKGKITTSLAYGLPVVTTSIGAEGMALENGTHALIADEPESFADAIGRLLTDDELWRRLSEQGLDRLAAGFSPAAARASLERVLDMQRERNP